VNDEKERRGKKFPLLFRLWAVPARRGFFEA